MCALKEAVHALCPVFLLDVDQGLEFAQVMGVAGAVAHALEGEVGGVIVMDEDAFEVLFDIAASRADAQDGQEWGAQHVEPAGTGGDPQAGFVEVLDRDRCADHVCDMGEEGLEAPGGSPAHGGDRGCGDGHCEEVAHEFGQALLGNELGVQQVAHPGGDAWPVLDRGGHAVREDGSCHGGAGAAEAAMGAVFGDLQGAWLGHIEDLSTDGRAVTVGVRQRCAAARTGGGVMIHNMVRALGPRQRRSLVARLAAAWPAGLAALASGAPLGSALLAQAVAGGRLAAGGAVKRRAPLELGDAVPQGRVLPLERGILPDERRGQAQQPLAPFPEGLDDCGCEG